ncbi:MAG: CPBP family intramembrane metalloprotease [Cyanobacteria bacterium SID2]|nr:CPBP family intramembrane metalloprotease [Cyanobacteria bacterium SID2]MBP0005045.1 CPBP family intramembrane metalloprotease [Cyanobacteria bacterium SBC]
MKDRSIFIRIPSFIACLLLAWLPIAIPIYALVRDSNLASILGTLVLYLEFLGLAWWWNRRFYGERRVFQRYGLIGGRRNGLEFGLGWGVGLLSLAILLSLETVFGWVAWRVSELPVYRLLFEAVLVGSAVGFAEEFLFRGWLWDELRRDLSVSMATVANAVLFALLHFLKPFPEVIRTFPQFLGLLVLGLALVGAKCRTEERLGFSIGLHGGLVGGYYIANVGQLIAYTGTVPDWVTGIDNNPLAGVLGVGLLGSIAWAIFSRKFEF